MPGDQHPGLVLDLRAAHLDHPLRLQMDANRLRRRPFRFDASQNGADSRGVPERPAVAVGTSSVLSRAAILRRLDPRRCIRQTRSEIWRQHAGSSQPDALGVLDGERVLRTLPDEATFERAKVAKMLAIISPCGVVCPRRDRARPAPTACGAIAPSRRRSPAASGRGGRASPQPAPMPPPTPIAERLGDARSCQGRCAEASVLDHGYEFPNRAARRPVESLSVGPPSQPPSRPARRSKHARSRALACPPSSQTRPETGSACLAPTPLYWDAPTSLTHAPSR